MNIKRTFTALLTLCFSGAVFAQADVAAQSTVDLVWVVLCGALVFMMQAGFGLIESGMSRAKNSVNVIMKNYTDVCVGSLIFFCVGYGLMFGTNNTGFWGTDRFLVNASNGGEWGFIFFQTMFAATAVTIASGAMAERTKFVGYIVGAIFICAIIYPIFGSWVWGSHYDGQGWLAERGFIDFAGSTVVHSVGAWCALAGIIVLGPRLGRFTQSGQVSDIPAHNMMFLALGGFLLWVGWFGFNAGSTFAANDDIGLIVYNTQLAASAGVVGVIFTLLVTNSKILASKIINGSLAGLVSSTAGAATMDPGFAMLTGFIAGFIYLLGEEILRSFNVDDVVGAVSVHGFCGVWGTLAAGLFYKDNLFDVGILVTQLIGVGAAFLWAFPLMYIFFKVIDATIGLRASATDEMKGLDYTEHYELAYPEFQSNKLFNDK